MEHLIKINLPGGLVSAGDFYEMLLIAEKAGASNIRFGNRQQLYFTIHEDHLEDLETEMLKTEIRFEIDCDARPNIISSYVGDTIFNQEGWLREGLYKDILDSFDYQPRLKVNLVDNQQTFVPFFSGNFNFITSDISNYWFFYIRFLKSGKHFCFPSLVYSDDISSLAKTAEDLILTNKKLFFDQEQTDEQLFFKLLAKKANATLQPITSALKLPAFQLPYYEGFNKYNNRYWLGVYRRNELYPLEFLKDVCLLCLKTRIGQLYTTPWKSIIIKGIDPAERNEWGLLLSKYQLNVRHAANELNWQVEDICDEGLALKKQLVREFEEADLRTYQLCFAIKTQPKTGLPGSIIIKKTGDNLFDIFHTRDFNPNSKDYITYSEKVKADIVAPTLISLCNIFYKTQSRQVAATQDFHNEEADVTNALEGIYQCNNCHTRYDKAYGDDVNCVDKGIEFETLAEYCCPVCDSPKSEFSLMEVCV
ncbi:rubredoxin domain-containing protein [Mucilaginibacter gotjawali]|uniref:Rubredoxin n=2 Tax=Mucilaginibacter gotjawali TaxID=1550579 RepID=A0A110B0I6_9SPHI|nr:rubredoxin domain-containing protein [Mucilaginibacter gotjawali]MBB3058496.1 rubredoxin [Mucilaginibacter gotjawali]BAU55720.1 Rubredoxin [Mucilaginibacter gotjawali]